MNRDDWRTIGVGALMAAAVVLLAPLAHADHRPPQPLYTCEDVRRIVAEHGKVKALAMAIEAGATWAQIRAARQCLNAK